MVTVVKQYPTIQRLPTPYATAIGHVISRWAHLEWLLARITYQVLGVNPKQGRIAVREARAEDYIGIIQQLLKVRKLTVPLPAVDLKSRLKNTKEIRDHLAHGLWLRHPTTRELRVWRIKGEPAKNASGEPSVPFKMAPEATRRTSEDIATTYKEIDSLIALALEFEKAILRALSSSRKTPPSRSARPRSH